MALNAPLLRLSEEQHVLALTLHTACHGPVVEFPREKCIHQLVEEQAERTPDAVAVVFHDEQLTYRELDQRAGRLARYLRKQGVGSDSVVGVCIERSVEMTVGVLAVLKAGGAYLGLDPAYPQERFQLMVEDARVQVLLTQERFSSRFETIGTPQIFIDKDWLKTCAEHDATLPSSQSSDQLAFIVFTSGSTGRPKGVAITHAALANLIAWQVARNTAKPRPRTLQFASLSFDVSFQEIFSTWSAGGTLVLADEDVRHDPRALLRVLTEQRIESVDVPYVALQYLSELVTTENIALPSLRYFIAAGEQLKITPRIRRFFEQLNGCTVDNHYGPSETHVVCGFILNGPPSAWPELPPIGRPGNNAQLYVLDKHMQPAPLGTAGELYIGGESLARGYLNRPELTAEKFGPNPYSAEPGARLYRTGDLARYLPDGNIEFIGRVDNQVKLRGYRIELEEIEVALQQHPAVGQAVVMARQDGPGEKRLVAYIVAAQDMSPSVTELRNYLKQKLPDYMVPAAFVLLDVLPLTPNGKLDRRALTVSDSAGVELRSAFIEPRNELESRLTQIWETILNIRPIGVRDNFWDLGGHSLAGTRLLNEMRQTFNCDLPISILFQELTVEQLAKILCPEETVTVASPFMALQPHGSRPPFFIGGSNPRLTNLARYLGLDQPSYKLDVYALQEECLQTGRAPYTRIDAIATHFIEKIRAVQPVGPYFLGGGCEGGYVAYEVARQLQRQGESIAMLLLWEVPPTPFSRKKPLHPAYYLAHQLRSLVRHGPKKLMKKLLAKARRGNNSHPLSAEASRFQWLQSANHQALQNYKPQKYSGPIILFRAHDQPPGTYDPTVGWDELVTGEIEIHILPGNHTTYTALHFLDFAERLKTCLDKAHSAALLSRRV